MTILIQKIYLTNANHQCQVWANCLGTMVWSRVYSDGVGLLKLSKLGGASSWMGDCLATVQDLVSVVILMEGRLLLEGRALFPWLWKVQCKACHGKV